MKQLTISMIIRLILLTTVLSLFFACSSTSTSDNIGLKDSLGEILKDDGNDNGATTYWAIPEQFKNVPIEQIKAQVEITEYRTIKGADTTAGTESMGRAEKDRSIVRQGGGAVEKESAKNKADRDALASYKNKIVSLEGVIALTGTQKNSPLDILEPEPGKYEIWFCTDKNQQRKPCRYRTFLLYEGPEGKGDTLFTRENIIRFWGIITGEEIKNIFGNFKRFPKIRVLEIEVIK